MDNLELAQKWSGKMLQSDASYRVWAQQYSGIPDIGSPAPIWEVSPGAIIAGPVGYVKVDTLEDLLKPWDWHVLHTWKPPLTLPRSTIFTFE
jgi:hypothetical protein